MKKLTLIVFTFLFQIITFAQQQAVTPDGKKILLFNDGSWRYGDTAATNMYAATITALEIPTTDPKHIITHTGYSLSYNGPHQQANWVAYILTKEKTTKLFDRKDNFMPDPLIKICTTTDKDYARSGYDRGHLAPAADMCWSATAMDESFYYSNMSPQVPAFNRGVWNRLEELVRNWAIENDSVYIVTGPVLNSSLKTMGTSNIAVAKYFYKVIVDYKKPGIKGIGFIVPNAASKEPLQHFAVTIDSVEKLTNIDFFPLLPDEQEAFIEKTLCTTCWTWNSTNTNHIKVDNKLPVAIENNRTANTVNKNTINLPAKKTASVQCSGTTKSGGRCKRMTTSSNGRCYQH